MNNSIWLSSDSGSLTNGELRYDNSTRTDHKRSNRWFLNASEQDLFFNKKLAIESSNGTPGHVVMENSLWHSGSSSHPEFQRCDHSNSLKPIQCPTVSAPITMEKNGFENQSSNNSSIFLNMPQLVGNNNFFPREENNMMGRNTTFQRTGHINTCPGPTYNNITNGNKQNISAGQTSGNTARSFGLTNQFYNGIDNNLPSIGQSFNGGNYNMNTNGNPMSIGPTYGRSYGNHNAVNPFYSKGNEPFMLQSAYNKMLQSAYNKNESAVLPYTNDDSNKSKQRNPEDRDLISGYDALLNQPSGLPNEASRQKDSQVQQTSSVTSAAISKAGGAKKIKEVKTKKGSSNNFPSNVKSLLSTGIYDGVPVKYVSWSREKNLRGVIRGTGYLCTCEDCKMSKSVNAYEFERHAGCKTKHPNNHIYFENGKTIYAVVQELKTTPQEMLFEVIQNATGSPVNQKNFNTWKGSYQAATRELQRIYREDEAAAGC